MSLDNLLVFNGILEFLFLQLWSAKIMQINSSLHYTYFTFYLVYWCIHECCWQFHLYMLVCKTEKCCVFRSCLMLGYQVVPARLHWISGFRATSWMHTGCGHSWAHGQVLGTDFVEERLKNRVQLLFLGQIKLFMLLQNISHDLSCLKFHQYLPRQLHTLF